MNIINTINYIIPNGFETGCGMALNSVMPNAFKNSNKWIIMCIPIYIVKIIHTFFLVANLLLNVCYFKFTLVLRKDYMRCSKSFL